MSEPYTGGCTCGAVRYQVSGEPMMMNECRCRQCQRDSGTGHGSHLTFAGADVNIEGTAAQYEVAGENGTRKSRAFCPTCGAPVYLTLPDIPEVFVISAASLDEPERYRPQLIMWTAAGQPWDPVDPTLPAFAKMPPQGS